MKHSIVAKNINKLLKEKDWKISDLENKIGTNGSVANILRGSSKNPTIDLLQSIAGAFNVEIQDLLNETDIKKQTNTSLMLAICNETIKQIDELSASKNLGYKTIINIIRDVYEYSIHLDLEVADENFIRWTIHKNLDS
jgi:transcriptional regulator with XRE-family HTH domain